MKVLKIFVRLLVLVSLQGGLFGCGSNAETAAPAVSQMRALKAGDSWIYEISGQTSSGSYTGTSTVSITEDTIAGVSVLAATSTNSWVLNGLNTSTTSVSYMHQEATTGDLLPYGIKNLTTNNQVVTVTDRPLPIIWPGSWDAGETITAIIHYSNGTSETISYTINGLESVATPAGVITAWKLPFSGSSNAGISTGTFWFSTELGNYVRMDITNSAGTVTYALRSTTVK